MSANRIIFSREHNAWWAPNRNGYVHCEEKAGRYTFEQAEKLCFGDDEFHYAAPEPVYDLVAAAIDAVDLLEREGRDTWSGDELTTLRWAIDEAKIKREQPQ